MGDRENPEAVPAGSSGSGENICRKGLRRNNRFG